MVILANSGMTLGIGTALTSGQAIVNNQGGVAIIKTGFNAASSPTEIAAETIIVSPGPIKPELFDFFANTFDPGRGVVVLDQGPIALTSFPVLPNPPAVPNPFPSPGIDRCPAPGRIAGDCIVRLSSGPIVIQPGNYRKIDVRFGATLYFAGGTYNVKSLHGGPSSHIFFNGTTTINVTDTAIFEPRAEFVPASLTEPNPRCIRVNVLGDRVAFRVLSKISGTFIAPSAFMTFGSFGVYEGNFAADTVRAYQGTTLTDPVALSGPCP